MENPHEDPYGESHVVGRGNTIAALPGLHGGVEISPILNPVGAISIMERIIDLNEPMEGSIDLDSDHEDNLHCGSTETKAEGSPEAEGLVEAEVEGSTEPELYTPVIKDSASQNSHDDQTCDSLVSPGMT
ncbi:hypothetical protein Sjap_002946 [Stephania japonica]|uniref:Uncharacterized protein n=1 Tax=Stephania japonica TaxID=461633 RepID=A0AAP0KMT3_9MAGN